MKLKFLSPLSIKAGRKKFILNLNQYRNTHYRVTNNAKIKYKEFMEEQISKLKKKIGKSMVIYTVYKGDKRNFDVGNICAIHQKFFEDAMVELGKMDDDRYSLIPMSIFCFGGIDNKNPRVEIEVIPYRKGFIDKVNKKITSMLERLFND